MLLHAGEILELIEQTKHSSNPFLLVPLPQVEDEGSASIDMRLGTWFASLRCEKNSKLDIYDEENPIHEKQLIKYHYVPFGGEYILHPRAFVLGITLEWMRFSTNHGGYVVGKSSWGRRGLIIATAAGVHPGFTGCLTLELCNSGEIPITLKPGMTICQLFIHKLAERAANLDNSQFIGKRKPNIGKIAPDPIAKALAKGLG